MRQFSCIELTARDALILRDLMRPLTRIELYDQSTLVRLCEKLYAAILRARMDPATPLVNVRLDKHEAILVNHFIGSEDWDGATALLEQTWLVLYELGHDAAYPHPREPVATTVDRLSASLHERGDSTATSG